MISIVAAALAAVSCDFLNVEVTGKATTEDFFRDFTGLKMSGYGLLYNLREWYDGDVLQYADLASDLADLTVNADYGQVNLYNFTLRA